MANRVLQQKMLKKKRAGKYKLRSGAPTGITPSNFRDETPETYKFGSQVVNHSMDGKPRRQLWKEAKEYLDNYHANISVRRDTQVE